MKVLERTAHVDPVRWEERTSTAQRLSEWRLPLIVGAALAAVTAIPYLYAYAVQPPGHVFVGFFYLWDDATTYLAKMREGWEGGWAWQNRYTTESGPTAYLFFFWIALGHFAAVTHLPLIVVFHLARVAAAFALMAGGWLFITHFVEDRTARRFALFFLAFGLGLGLVIWGIGRPTLFDGPTEGLDLRMPELSAFYSVLALPHFAWSGVFAAFGVPLTLRAIQRGNVTLGVLAGLAWLGQASIHPQMPVLMGGAALAATLWRRPASPRGWVAGAVAFAIPAPYVLYSYLAFVGNPEVERWTFHSKNAVAPETVSLLFALAPQLLLAAFGVPGAIRRRSREDVFLLAWLVLLGAVLWLPNPAGDLRRRFFDAIYLPLVVLAARGMYESIVPRLRSLRARRLIPFAYVTVSAVGSAFLLLAPLGVAAQPQYTITTAEYDGFNWLGSQPGGRVLCMPGIGLYVPAYSSDTVYVGHYDETFDYPAKTQIAGDLLTGKTDLTPFVQQNDIRYVIWTSDLQSPPPPSLGTPAYDTPDFKIWRLF
ncbi:MAG TPA: hypothetical protein VKE27_14375 [Candidatus Dormibacteraeota bacterium]|nr:hypothetical protein [Candidatus Dormibacteraeota bacterium]